MGSTVDATGVGTNNIENMEHVTDFITSYWTLLTPSE